MLNFMLLATAWGPKHGGINAFNMDFAIGLAQHLGTRGKVFCTVFRPSKEDIENARAKEVRLLSIDRPIDSAAYDPSWALDVSRQFEQSNPGEHIDWWVGHDVTTGWAAVEGPGVAKTGQSALIMHMNYSDYQAYKGGVGQRAAEKERDQRRLFAKAGRCFANGPLLRDALQDIVQNVVMLVPGFADVPVHPAQHRLHLITFGRMDRESDRIKQGGLAVAGFAAAVRQAFSNAGLPEELKENAQMRVVGIKEPNGDEERALKALAFEKAGRQVNLLALTYDEDRNELFDQLGRSNISLMLSWHEGFGLTGWEAIAGEVPLIVSRQTGLWQLLKETFGESFAKGYVRIIEVRGREGDDDTANFLPQDEEAVRDAIIDCTSKMEESCKVAAKLKRELKEKLVCTWTHTAKQFCDGLGIEESIPVEPVGIDLKMPTVPVQTAKSGFVSIPKSVWPEGIEMPDSMLLRPESRVVRFHHLRESLRDKIVGWAVDPAEFIKLHLVAGKGGAGKTRLMIEVCVKLEMLHGWRAGFIDKSQSIATGLPALRKEGKPCLIVLDYAEGRTSEIVELVRVALASPSAPQVCLILLARDGGDWWERLSEAAANDQATAAVLRGINTKTGPYRMTRERIEEQDRDSVFSEALRDFARCKNLPLASAAQPDLSKNLFEDPLFIHLAALATLRGLPSADDRELLSMTLGHERSYWRQLLASEGLPDEHALLALEQAVALFTLCGGKRTARETKELLAESPRARALDPTVRLKLFDVLRRLYPLDGGVGGLQPDLLGEALVSEALASDDELLDIALDRHKARNDVRYALTVLTRLGRRAPGEQRWLRRALEIHLLNVSEDALHVGMETGAPMPEVLAAVINSAGVHERKRTVYELRIRLPKETDNLKNLTVEVRRQVVAFLETKKTGQGAKRDIALSDALSSLAMAFKDKGLLAEAADAEVEAARRASAVYRSGKQDDLLRLGRLLGNLSNRLGEVGRFDDALAAAVRTELLWRGLAETRSDAHTAGWATSLSNLGSRLRDVGRFGEALTGH